MKSVNIKISDELHRQYKVKAFGLGMTLQQVGERLVNGFISDNLVAGFSPCEDDKGGEFAVEGVESGNGDDSGAVIAGPVKDVDIPNSAVTSWEPDDGYDPNLDPDVVQGEIRFRVTRKEVDGKIRTSEVSASQLRELMDDGAVTDEDIIEKVA